jgi:Tfp pilus assembly protein PilV
MRRFRLSTLMLLIVVAALGFTLVVLQRQAARREAESRIRIQMLGENLERIMIMNKELRFRLEQMGKGAK